MRNFQDLVQYLQLMDLEID